jgi:hypothetical protein
VVYLTGQGAVGVSPADGRLRWRFNRRTDFDINAATPVYADGCLLLSSNYGSGDVLLRLKAEGEPEGVWKSRAMENHFSPWTWRSGSPTGQRRPTNWRPLTRARPRRNTPRDARPCSSLTRRS